MYKEHVKELPVVGEKEQDARDNVDMWISNVEGLYDIAHEHVMKYGIERAAKKLAYEFQNQKTPDNVAYTKNRLKYALMCNFENTYANAVCAIHAFILQNSELHLKALAHSPTHMFKLLRQSGIEKVGKTPISINNLELAMREFKPE